MIRTTRCGQFCTAKSPGAPKGNTNALKHGRYSGETIEARRKIAALLRTMRTVVRAYRQTDAL